MPTPVDKQIALLRVKMIAGREAERARRLLMAAGFEWRKAGRTVLELREKGNG